MLFTYKKNINNEKLQLTAEWLNELIQCLMVKTVKQLMQLF